MCGTIALRSGERIKPGGDLSLRLQNGKILSGPWLGFMREESYHRLWQDRVALGILPEATGYEEKEHYFQLPSGLFIRAGWSLGERGIRIMTRPALSLLETSVHHRHPKLVAA